MNDVVKDLSQIGTSVRSREILDGLRADGHVADALDGYRLAIAVAIGFGRTPDVSSGEKRSTSYAVGGLDSDGAIRKAISEIYPEVRDVPARAAEDLAEQGLAIIDESREGEGLSLGDLVSRVRSANVQGAETPDRANS